MHTIDIFGVPDATGKAEHYAYSLASSWDDLPLEAFRQLAVELVREDDDTAIRIRAFRAIAGIPASIQARVPLEDLLQTDGTDATFLPQLDAFLAPPVFHRSFLPHLTVDGQEWIGPTDSLGNFTVLRLSFTDLCFGQLGEDGSPRALANLLGALYHPAGTEWNNDDIESRGAALATLPTPDVLAAVLNYRGLRATLPLRYPRTFQGTEESDDFGIDGLLEGLAGDKFGTVDTVGAKPIHLALVSCERMHQRNAELKTAHHHEP